ncbi:MAG TPA: argininosuccinate lyase [Porphyromonadaceae bacterium]|nr:argininosuccinate lyase [Porphyromonadaceae bacterium]
MKLWQKNILVDKSVEEYTVGRDKEMDLYLAPYDIMGSMAHIKMLESVGLLSKEELNILLPQLRSLYQESREGNFIIEDGVEDVHSQVEFLLTERVGAVGKKIHSGRSRNDQVLLDLKLFTRSAIKDLVSQISSLIDLFIRKSEEYKDVLMPGYTHLQIAMPSSFGLWFGAYAESLVDDLMLILSSFKICNRNPLGSAAGYGSSFPLDRQQTTDFLGFDTMDYNSIYAQMGRGKMEKIVSFAVSSVASTIGKLAFDACLFNSQNFGFIKLSDEYTTGSSIMPHKKNPDVFEITRAKCNKIQSIPQQILLITNNLPSGYFRDMQIIKEIFLPLFEEMHDILSMVGDMVEKLKVNKHILEDKKYLSIFSVEEVNRRVNAGVPFRDAYKQVGLEIEAGNFNPDISIHHTHEGSIGNLCNDKILELKRETLSQFHFEKIEQAEKELLGL